MCNNTVEDYYKIAVKKRYEEVKNGVNFNFLYAPTRGKLRTLCWELFETQNMHSDDLVVFNCLLGFPFDLNTKNTFKKHSNEFRPIETFLKGETDPLSIEVVDMAAILVDFPLRPFNKFRIQNLYKDEIENNIENNSDVSNPERRQIESSGNLDVFIEEKEKEKEKGIENETTRVNSGEKVTDIEVRKPTINSFAGIEKNPEKVNNAEESGKSGKSGIKWKDAIIIASVFLFIGFVVIYFAFPNKKCMQWSGDHYEIVECELEIQSAGNFSNIEILNPTLVNLKKIKVCDTTHFFKNGKPVVFYARSGDSLECFNQIGPHPERPSQYLKPITQYMIGEYISNKPCK